MDLETVKSFLQSHRTSIVTMVIGCISWQFLKKYRAGGVCTSTKRVDNKVIIITGCNTGIGKETAMELARRGATIVMACRDIVMADKVAKGIIKATGNSKVYVHKLDLASFASIHKFCEEVKQKYAKVDVLINNAGVMHCPEQKTEDGLEMQFGTNHIGHFLLTNLLLDRIKQSAPSRIVNVSSLAHYRGEIYWDDVNFQHNPYQWRNAYSQSKLANVLFTRELARRLKDSDVIVTSLHPGVVSTDLARHWLSAGRWVIAILYTFKALVCKSPVEGAQTTLHCVLADDLVSGGYYSDCKLVTPSAKAQSDSDALRLWNMSESLAKLR